MILTQLLSKKNYRLIKTSYFSIIQETAKSSSLEKLNIKRETKKNIFKQCTLQ